MRRFAPLVALLAAALGLSARADSLDWPVWRPGSPWRSVAAYRGDRVSVQLRPAATQALRSRSFAVPARSVGLAGVDGALASLAATLEPEFRGETPPPAGAAAPDFTSFFLVHLPASADLEAALARLRAAPEVASASPIGIAPVVAVPDDSLWAGSWCYYQPSRRDIHGPEAWDITRGDTAIVVALIDTGLIPYHPDIGGTTAGSRGQIWTNWVEAGGIVGVDDDRNGYVDDEWGWDFVALEDGEGVTPGEDWRDEDGDPNDFVGHGTSVAGLIGALSDNRIGVTGTAWEVRIMPLRVGWSEVERQTGVVDMSYLAQAVRYATRMGAHVINISLSNTALLELDAAVDAALAAGVTVVVAAGNNDSPNWLKNRPGVIHVAATDQNDVLPRWTNLGPHVSLTAPGAGIATTTLTRTGTDSLGLRQPSYIPDANGTSFSAPLVSGAVALLQANRRRLQLPLLTPAQVRLVLMGSCDDIAAQNSTVPADYYGAGRLNLWRALSSGAATVRATNLGGASVGAVVDFTTSTGQRRLALPTAARKLAILDARTLEHLGEHDLGWTPSGDLAAAELGGGRGLGFFVLVNGKSIAGLGGAGAPLPGWPVTVPFSTTSPALGDLDGNGLLDVVSVGSYSVDNAISAVWAWDGTGRLRPGFPVAFGPYAGSAVRPGLADLDGLPGLEIVTVDRDGWVYAFRHDGRLLPGWPVRVTGGTPISPVIARRGSAPLVVVLNRNEWHGLAGDGTEVVLPRVHTTVNAFDPVLADLDQDGSDDVLVSTPAQIQAWYLGDAPPAVHHWPVTVPVDRPFLESPLVGHLTPQTGPEVLAPAVAEPLWLALDGATIADPPVGFLIFRPSLTPPSSGTRTMLSAMLDQTGLLSVDLAEGSWAPDPQPWPTSRGNFARTGSRWGSPPLGVADVEPPDAVADLEAVALATRSVRLTWRAPYERGGLDRAIEYDLRVSRSPTGEGDLPGLPAIGVSAPRPGGMPETLVVHVEEAGGQYFFRLRARDASGNWSASSNEAYVRTPTALPAPIADLRVAASSESTLTVHWSATGDDGWIGRPDRYDLRVSPLFMTESEYERAPFRFIVGVTADAGAAESTTVGPLPQDTRYWFRVEAVDAGGLASGLSNVGDGWTLPRGAHHEDAEAPAPVADLRGEVLDLTRARLTWTAPSDDAPFGRAVEYDMRKASVAITPGSFEAQTRLPTPAFPRVAGERETLLVTAPASGTGYYALRAADAVGHWSGISNVVELIAPTTPPGPVTDLLVTARTESTIVLAWTACGEDGQVGRPARYEVRASAQALTLENFERAPHRVSVPATSTAGEPESTVVGGLSANTALWVALRAVDGYGIQSTLSNQIYVRTLAPPGASELSLALGANPTTPPVVVSWALASGPPDALATLAIYDVRGRRVRDWSLPSGPFGVVSWDGSDGGGRRLPAGLYFARLSARAGIVTRRFTLLW